jgi:hypothetical protein
MNSVQTKLYNEIGADLASIVQFSLIKGARQFDKSRNDLSSSNLVESIKYQLTPEGIDVIANSYWKNIEFGSPVGTVVPYADLYFWAKRYRIRPFNGIDFNTMIWLIRASIRRKGIKARPFIENALKIADVNLNPFLDEFTSNAIDSAFEDFSK